ncbi:MAG: oligopeptide transporter, OPT family [Planctomycetes bacterium]|nr:oligopeptide transporter, OPT family [Planctomycetota bacterium]MCB9870345.1 oligopeptide transporter, OPT family [Planctomycetota bacterium]
MTEPKPPHAPLVGPNRSLPEITLKAAVLGVLLAMLMAAANAYLGLRVGMTVAASIPASAIALGVLRMFRRSNILENNQVQTIASAGASTVSGIIFTVPALVMMGAWKGYDYGPIFMMVVIGGVMGVVFTTPLRRALIVDAGLTFPEGLATAEVLKTGGIERDADVEQPTANRTGALGFRLLLESSVVGALFKLCEGGLKWLAGEVAITRSLFGGRWLFTADATLAPSLLGIGFIVGPNIGTLMLSGAVIGTILGVPINWWLNEARLLAAAGIPAGTSMDTFTVEQWSGLAGASWQECRRIGIGCMLVGGVWSLINLAKPMVRGIRASLDAFRAKRAGGSGGAERTELDTPLPFLVLVAAVLTVPLFLVFRHALGEYSGATGIALVMTVLMLGFGFLFCSVAGYMTGLVGSSNNPVSGVTMATVVVSSLLLLQLMGNDGVAGRVGPAAVIYLAAFICTASCIAGDNLQDLKCGHVVGATPWKQQLCLVIGSIASAAVIPKVLSLLDQDQGIGRAVRDGVKPLAAPQASLMRDLSTGIFGAGINWNFILFGCALAVLIIALDEVLRRRGSTFRTPILAVAVGIYLPLGLSVLIFLGGLLSWLAARRFQPRDEHQRTALENSGMLLASGLITGEAIMGVLLALVVAAGIKLSSGGSSFGGALALAATAAMVVYLFTRTLGAARRMV